MGFLGRCAATRVPTTENDTVQVGRTAIEVPSQARKISPRVRPLRRARIRLATPSRHSDQAIQAANRMLILLSSPPPVSLPLLSQPHSTAPPSLMSLLQGSAVSELLRVHLPRTWLNKGKKRKGLGCYAPAHYSATRKAVLGR